MKDLKEFVILDNRSGVSYYYDNFSSLWITEGDRFTVFGEYVFKVERIFRERSQILTVADDKDAVLIKRMD